MKDKKTQCTKALSSKMAESYALKVAALFNFGSDYFADKKAQQAYTELNMVQWEKVAFMCRVQQLRSIT